MASFTDTVKLVFDAETSKATAGVKNIRNDVAQAEGVFGKLKAGASGAFDAIGSAGPLAVAGAATAIGAFAYKAIGQFQDLALAANDFAVASGLSVEEASRWMEVAGDVGVSTETLEGAVNKLNIAASKGALKELGVGGDTTNERLINALQHLQGIEDSAERARQGMALFGKSWAQLAPLVQASGDLRANLAGIEKGKVINEEGVKRAQHLRDAMDELNGVFEDFTLQLGAQLIEPLADVAEGFGNLYEQANKLSDVIPGTGGALGLLTSPLRNVTDGFNTASDSSLGLTDRARGLGQAITGAIPGPLGSWASGLLDVDDANVEAEESTKRAAEAAKEQAAAADEAAKALHALYTATLASFNANLALEDATDKTTDAIGEYAKANDTAAAAGYGNAEANDAARKALNDAEQAALTQAAAAAKLAEQTAIASGAAFTDADAARVQADALRTVAGTLDPNSALYKHLQGYIAQLDKIPPTKNTKVDADTSGAERELSAFDTFMNRLFPGGTRRVGVSVSAGGGGGGGSFSATGAAAPTGLALVPAGPSVGATGLLGGNPGNLAASRAGTSIVVNVSAAPLTNPAEIGKQVADYLDAFYRRNGTRLRATA